MDFKHLELISEMVMRLSEHAEKHAVLKGHYFFPSLLEQTFKQMTKMLSVNGASVMGQGVVAAPA